MAARTLILAVAAVFSGCQRNPSTHIGNESKSNGEILAVRQRLRVLSNRDQDVRRQGRPWATVDRENCQELRTVVDRYGWPGIKVWGAEADFHAWLITQHCPDLQFQRRVLSVMEKLLKEGDTRPQNYAFLFDRVAIGEALPDGTVVDAPENHKQRYGTQGKCEGSRWEPFALEEPAKVDALRSEVGLEPLNQYRASITCP